MQGQEEQDLGQRLRLGVLLLPVLASNSRNSEDSGVRKGEISIALV